MVCEIYILALQRLLGLISRYEQGGIKVHFLKWASASAVCMYVYCTRFFNGTFFLIYL